MLTESNRLAQLRESYGDLLTPADLAKILRYPSEEAVVKAHLRGTLPVSLAKFRGRRGWFVTAELVAEILDDLDKQLRGVH